MSTSHTGVPLTVSSKRLEATFSSVSKEDAVSVDRSCVGLCSSVPRAGTLVLVPTLVAPEAPAPPPLLPPPPQPVSNRTAANAALRQPPRCMDRLPSAARQQGY